MPKKEDRSDWVAVQPEFASAAKPPEIRKPVSAYQYYQKHATPEIKRRMEGPFDIAKFGRAVRDQWNALSESDQEPFLQLARDDAARYARESQQADAAALERKLQLQKERQSIVVLDIDYDNDDQQQQQRTTRKRLEQHVHQQNNREDASSNDDSPKPKRAVSEKQQAYLTAKRLEHQDKETYIRARHDALRTERAAQAKRRLQYLLQQSSIFSHFGMNQNKNSIVLDEKNSIQKQATTTSSRRDSAANQQEDEAAALEEADEHEAVFLTAQPTTLGHGVMRDYQLEGLNWMIRLQENGVNGILADEMGLGKTLQSISILVYMKEYRGLNGPHLVLVPKSTLSNWMNEFARWAPSLRVIRFHGDKATRETMIQQVIEPAQRDENRTWDVVVATYEVCNIEKNTLQKFAWSYLIIDEAHRLKNEASSFSKTVRQFETRHRLLLTGTPLQNSLHELWALLNFLVPDVFESAEQFDEWFNLDIDDNDEKNKLISQLHKILRPFMLRRLKADVEKSLPPKHETILFTGMSKMQKDLYRNILVRDIDAIQGTSGSRTAILNIVMQLRKCAGHPYLFPSVEDRTLPPLGEHLVENCGKMVVLDKLLMRLEERGHRVLLFTQMTRILDIMEDYLVMRKFKYCRIDGNTSYDDREERIDAYNAPGSDKFIFLLSTRAGGLGINLQTADVVILYDSDWNPQADLQAQDRAHRIGQKRPVQVFRLVTEHTIESKIVERAQQKLKLDAMVVQQGRLKDKDKLSRDELLAAVRFGADKIFKSKDSSITDDDIDMILDAGRRKTEALNEKLQAADKGDLLDFKFDGSSVQTFEGVDYSGSAIAAARAQAEMLGIFDIGKRERKEANYNEKSLYQQQIAAISGSQRKPKKKLLKLPKNLRLPRMEEWQMYDRDTLRSIHEEEEAAFKALPEEHQKLAVMKDNPAETAPTDGEEKSNELPGEAAPTELGHPFELPPLISEERQALKDKLLAEGFASWRRLDFSNFVRASARFGRNEIEKIALDVGMREQDVKSFADAFWGDLGKTRISEHEYDRAVKMIERGEKKLIEIVGLERGIRKLLSIFDNPWEELEFTFEKTKDKMFTCEEDRHLLCWIRKYGYGQWQAIRMAIRRNPNFRFNYFLRSLPVEQLARRCEQLAKAAEKEVEQLERKVREDAGLPVQPEKAGDTLPPIELPKFRDLQTRQRNEKREKITQDRHELETKVNDLESQIRDIQNQLQVLNEGSTIARVSPDHDDQVARLKRNGVQNKQERPSQTGSAFQTEDDNGAPGPDGAYVAFPLYDGGEEPAEWKKPFTQFCNRTRKAVKASLDPDERKDKKKIQAVLKEQWLGLNDDKKEVYRLWSEWDKARYEHDFAIFNKQREGTSAKRKASLEVVSIPKKKSKK